MTASIKPSSQVFKGSSEISPKLAAAMRDRLVGKWLSTGAAVD